MMYHTCPCCHEIWSVDARIIGQTGYCNGCSALITLTDETSLIVDRSPPRLRTALRGFCVILGWSFFLECCFQIPSTIDPMTDALHDNTRIGTVTFLIMLTAHAVPLLYAFVIGLLLIGLTHVLNRENRPRFTACIRWATLACLLFSISSVFVVGYFSANFIAGIAFDIAMRASLAGWIFGAILGALLWRLRQWFRDTKVRHDSPFQPLDAQLVSERL